MYIIGRTRADPQATHRKLQIQQKRASEINITIRRLHTNKSLIKKKRREIKPPQ